MNLEAIDQDLRDKILEHSECIGFFVYLENYLWIIDWEAHFNLDQKKNFDAHLKRGDFKKDKYENALLSYRGGIPTLLSDRFPKYRDSQSAKVVNTKMLREEFFRGDQGQYSVLESSMQEELSFNKPMADNLVDLRCQLFSKLPKFYVNFDRKIFMHMVKGRTYEAVIPDGWWGAECDFEHMIPTYHRYWVRSCNEDYWAITSFSM